MAHRRVCCLTCAAMLPSARAHAQQAPAPAPGAQNLLPTIDVVATTPLSGSGVDVNTVPAAVTTIDSHEIAEQHSANVVSSLNARTPSVNVSVVSGNAFQPDVTFRGFVASPVAGTPQGLAIYQNGVRINESFGDVVNWDFLPTVAIHSIDVVGNNPAFGLNALGGAISLQMKNGFTYQGGSVDVMAGSFGRLQSSLQYGKLVDNWSSYIAIEGVTDDGFRYFSPSRIQRGYGDIGYRNEGGEYHINLGGASNAFGATASAPWELLQSNWSSVYTTPQTVQNQVGYVNATASVNLTPTWTLQANAYVRSYFQRTQDGNATNAQPCADPTLLCYGDTVTPANGRNGQQLSNPFPASATLGENDRTTTQTTSTGAAVQASNVDKLWGHDNHFVVGASLDCGVTHFGATAELGTVQPNFVVDGSGLYLGPSGNPTSDGPVSVLATNLYEGAYAADTFDVNDRLSLTAGAVTPSLTIGGELFAVGPQYFVGDPSNQNPQLPGYAVVNATVTCRVTSNFQVYAKADNLLDHRDYTYGTYFDTGAIPNFAKGGAPFVDPRSLTPAAPQAFCAGVRATF